MDTGSKSGVSPLPDEVYAGTLDCVHCGLCLTACPTYRATGKETSSPRGRIYLMRGVAEGRIELGPLVASEARLCLGCRACETACPAGVEYGSLLEATRTTLASQRIAWGWSQRVERWILREIVPRPRRLGLVLTGLAVVQRLGLDRLAKWVLPRRFGQIASQAPPIPPRARRARLPSRIAAQGERRGRVAFFEGCVMPEIFGDINRATVELLSRQGFEVWVPSDQVCCGALQAHAGDAELANQLGERNAGVFGELEVDAVITNSAGCGAVLHEAPKRIGTGAERLGSLVRDVTQFLADVGMRGPLERVEKRTCYDDPCHLVHGQGVADAPRQLLEAIPGLELVSHEDPTSCCGAAGTYNLTQPAMSQEVLDRKIDALLKAKPEAVATGNPGCLMQLATGFRQRGEEIRVVHPVELLLQACPGSARGD